MAKNWQDYTEMTAALASGDDILLRDKSDTTDHATEGTVLRMAYAGLLGLSGLTPGGRLTLESGVPISTTDQTAKGTIYYTPDQHDFVRLYNGTRPHLYQFTERSLALTITSGKNYDVFLYDNSGTLTLELSAAWTTDTARADALAWQAGVGWVKSGTPTRLHLGTIRASGTNTTEQSFATTDAPAKSFVWNRFNQVARTATVKDSTDSWNYTTATWRQKRGSANNQIEFVSGDVIPWSAADLSGSTSNTGGVDRANGVGCDSTASYTGMPGYGIAAAGVMTVKHAAAGGASAAGYHYLAALEYATASGTTSWYGDAGVPSYFQTGFTARLVY